MDVAECQFCHVNMSDVIGLRLCFEFQASLDADFFPGWNPSFSHRTRKTKDPCRSLFLLLPASHYLPAFALRGDEPTHLRRWRRCEAEGGPFKSVIRSGVFFNLAAVAQREQVKSHSISTS